jgi:hypothetical protein
LAVPALDHETARLDSPVAEGADSALSYTPRRGSAMYAVSMTVTFNDRPAAESELVGLVSQVSGIPGFVAGYWVAISQEKGTAMIVFDSESSAEALAAQARSAPAGNVTTDSIEVGQVMGHA